MSLARLKWITIVVPVMFIGGVQWFIGEFFEGQVATTPMHLAELSVVAAGGIAFTVVLFRAVERIQRRVERQNAELSALNAVGRAVSGTQDLEAALSAALGSVMTVTGATAAEVVVVDDDGRGESLRVSAGPPEELAALRDAFPGDPLAPAAPAGEAQRRVRIVSIQSGLEPDGGPRATWAEVPLVAQDVSVGSLRLLAPAGSALRLGTTERLLAAIGSQLAVGIRAGNLFHDVLQRGEEAEALFEIGLKLASLQDTKRVLESVVEHASRALGAEVASLCTSGPEGNELAVARRTDPDEAFLQPASEVSPAPDWIAWIEEGVTGHGANCDQCPVVAAPYRPHHLAAPLRTGTTVIGHLCVSRHGPRAFTERDRDLLDGLADMAAIAVNNGRLLDRERQVAVLEERERLSREMHDNLAQVLGLLHLKVEMLRRTLAKDGAVDLSHGLEEISGIAQEAYQDAREAILGLRETLSPDQSLVATLRDYAKKFTRQSGIITDVELDGEPPQLWPVAELQIVRVIQEALTNVRKHADAQKAVIRISQPGREVGIAIEDDGRGFDMSLANRDGQHFGLHTMRERVEGAGGRLTIESALGKGTTVRIWFNRVEGEDNAANANPPGRRPGALPQRRPSPIGGRGRHDGGGGSV